MLNSNSPSLFRRRIAPLTGMTRERRRAIRLAHIAQTRRDPSRARRGTMERDGRTRQSEVMGGERRGEVRPGSTARLVWDTW
jgi:hypothetical protein